MLKDEPIAYQLEQYEQKEDVLGAFCEKVSAETMYEDIFPDFDLLMPIVCIDENEDKHILKMTIGEAIDMADGRNDLLMGGVEYFKTFISKSTAKTIYALIIDMDNVYSGILKMAFQRDWARADSASTAVPQPTYIVNSGHGLHLYFVFEKPLPVYKSQLEQIDQMYRRLAVEETTKRNYLVKSVQWFGQEFRIAGGCGKDGWENTCYRYGKKWNADELAKAVGVDTHFRYEGEKPVKKTENKKGKAYIKRSGYHLSPRVYETSLERCRTETHEGHRYTSMCALTVLAWKCNIPKDRLESDLHSLLPYYNRNSIRLIKEREIYSAMKMYNEKAMRTPKVRTQDWLDWEFKGSRRNGRKQADHLRRARLLRDADYPDGKWINKDGAPTKEKLVKEWRAKNPNGRKIDCQRDTGLSRPTVYKWWGD